MRDRPLTELSDEELFNALKNCVDAERECTVEVLLHLAEVDRRGVVESTGASSLFVYCVQILGYSEAAAYRRIRAARCARVFPRAYVLIRRGRITLTAVSLLAPHLRRENHRVLLNQACGMTKYELERLVATLEPRRELPDVIRPLGPQQPASPIQSADATLPMSGPPLAASAPADSAGTSVASTPSNAAPGPTERRVEFRFSADEDFLAKVRRAREVLWHKQTDRQGGGTPGAGGESRRVTLGSPR